jgi:glutathione S-transferase
MTVADPYLFAMLGWTGMLGIDLAKWPRLTAFRQRMLERPSVQAVMKAEGLA